MVPQWVGWPGAFELAWYAVHISKWPKIGPPVLRQGLTITCLGVENKNCVFPVLKKMSEKELILLWLPLRIHQLVLEDLREKPSTSDLTSWKNIPYNTLMRKVSITPFYWHGKWTVNIRSLSKGIKEDNYSCWWGPQPPEEDLPQFGVRSPNSFLIPKGCTFSCNSPIYLEVALSYCKTYWCFSISLDSEKAEFFS